MTNEQTILVTSPELQHEPPRNYLKNRWLFLSIFVGMFVFVVAITLFLWNTRDRSNSNAAMIKEYSGTNDGETEFFQVRDPWEIRWEHTGNINAIEWLGKETKSEAYVAMHKKPIRNYGQRYIGRSGEFRLKVSGQGPWKVQVWQFDKQASK